MKLIKIFSVLSVLFLMAAVSFPRNAYAYLDPGTGSYVFQLLIAALVGGAFAVKLFWGRIRTFLARLFKKEKVENNDETRNPKPE